MEKKSKHPFYLSENNAEEEVQISYLISDNEEEQQAPYLASEKIKREQQTPTLDFRKVKRKSKRNKTIVSQLTQCLLNGSRTRDAANQLLEEKPPYTQIPSVTREVAQSLMILLRGGVHNLFQVASSFSLLASSLLWEL